MKFINFSFKKFIRKSPEVFLHLNVDERNAPSSSSDHNPRVVEVTEVQTKTVLERQRNLEKVRRFRAKLKADPELLERQKKKEKLYREKQKAEGKLKSIKDLPSNQREKIRQYNREKKREERMKKSLQNIQEDQSSQALPKKSRRTEMRLRKKVTCLENSLKGKDRLAKKWEKRYKRLKAKSTKKPEENDLECKVYNTMKQGEKVIREQLIFKEVLVTQLEEKKSQMKDEKSKSLFSQCLAGKLLKKYKIRKLLTPVVSKYLQKKHLLGTNLSFCRSKTEKE